MNNMYSKYALDYAEAIKDNIYNSLYDRPSLLSFIEEQKFNSCLDMGCGSGAYIEELSKACKYITAIDQSEEFIKIVSSKYPEIKSYTCDINQGLNKEKDSSFDLVIAPLVIHYIKDFNKLFLEVSRVLKSEGIFIFSTHHPYLDYKDSPTGNYFKNEKITQLWNTLGDTKVEVSFYRRSLNETINALFRAGFIIDGFSEGKPSKKIKKISEEKYVKLTTKSQFIFIRAKKTALNN